MFPHLGQQDSERERCCRNDFGISMHKQLTYIRIRSKFTNNWNMLELARHHSQSHLLRTGWHRSGEGREEVQSRGAVFISLLPGDPPNTSSVSDWALWARNHSHHILLRRGFGLRSCQSQVLGWNVLTGKSCGMCVACRGVQCRQFTGGSSSYLCWSWGRGVV